MASILPFSTLQSLRLVPPMRISTIVQRSVSTTPQRQNTKQGTFAVQRDRLHYTISSTTAYLTQCNSIISAPGPVLQKHDLLGLNFPIILQSLHHHAIKTLTQGHQQPLFPKTPIPLQNHLSPNTSTLIARHSPRNIPPLPHPPHPQQPTPRLHRRQSGWLPASNKTP